jgi:hypothetical protein
MIGKGLYVRNRTIPGLFLLPHGLLTLGYAIAMIVRMFA